MRKIIAYLATSLDGFIADKNGGVDWLFSGHDFGFEQFFASVDTVLMGRKTFDTVLSFDIPWPYAGKRCVVFTHRPPEGGHPHAEFASGDPVAFARGLRDNPGKDIWVDGGATLYTQFAQAQAFDEWHLFVHPILLGDGVPLFRGAFPRTQLTLTNVRQFDCGLVRLSYARPASAMREQAANDTPATGPGPLTPS